MEITQLKLPQTNPLASDYMNGDEKVLSFFDYDYRDPSCFESRLQELQQTSFPRESLAEVLRAFQSRYGADQKAFDNIEKLEHRKAVTVVGGQQAGVLTGPFYTIHKCLSILKLAEQLEDRLHVPVVPIFWIAGEDHDFEEINHTYVLEDSGVKKMSVPGAVPQKQSASETNLDNKRLKSWVKEVVRCFGESEHTNDLLQLLEDTLNRSKTYVDWFAHLLTHLFSKRGLVMMDSGDPRLRSIEKPFFRHMIQENEALNERVIVQMERLQTAGYVPTVDVNERSAHLFYLLKGRRVLLERDERGLFRGKNGECSFTEQQMLKLLEDENVPFSNNVITRPLMQEQLLPTIAFIAGPGEISYWSTLQGAFRQIDRRVPPIVPRLTITLVDRKSKKWLAEHGLSVEDVMYGKLQAMKARWLERRRSWDLQSTSRQVKKELDDVHAQLRALADQVDPKGLTPIANKNREHLFKQIDYFAWQIERAFRGRHEKVLKHFDRIEACLTPKETPQERVWNVFAFMNEYGLDLVDRLVEQPYEFDGTHKVIYL
ncbi:MAG TPA: bacillithiol biosynthesis cysteine-adding enzyme BshC [Bacillales bacterium]|nr:bacillithiol biosynthesis cysteine-adding enzyme BshC [Bacillales bacterium]